MIYLNSTSGNFINDTQNVSDAQVSDRDEVAEDHENTLSDQEHPSQLLDMSLSAQNTPPSTSKKNKKNPKMSIFQSKLLDHLEKQELTDADELFLKSLLPQVKQLSDGKKLEFKMYVLKFFQNESYPQNNNYSYQTPVFNPQNNAPYFYSGYPAPIPNQCPQLPSSENISAPYQPKQQHFPPHNPQDGNHHQM